MNVFDAKDYRAFLRSYLDENKRRGVVTTLASACGCDRTYLSQTLSGKADLTPDHILRLSETLKLPETDANYLLFLLLRDRSTSPQARRSMQNRLDKIKNDAKSLTNRINSRETPAEISEEQKTRYYANWLYGAIHILTSIPAYQAPAQIAAKLNLTIVTTVRILKDLCAMGAVKQRAEKYINEGRDFYLPTSSPQSTSHHFNWRMKAIERTFIEHDIHYTVAFSVSAEHLDELREQILALIETQRKLVRSSGTEVAAVFCCDFFPVGDS
jgi:uncharacterized protein (TIGR02147 family)